MKGITLTERAFLGAKKLPATIALSLALIAAYFLLSGGSLFIGIGTLLGFSFSLAKPLNLLSYMAVHISLWHLATNAGVLVFFSAIVERRLGSRDVFGIFLFSGILTALFFSLIRPEAALIGASAGISGVAAAAFVVDVKKAAVGLAIAAIALLALFPGIDFAVEQHQALLEKQGNALETELTKAIESNDSEAISRITSQKNAVEEEIKTVEEGTSLASETRSDPFLHSYAAAFGIAYLLAFRWKKTRLLVKKQKLFRLGKKRLAG